MCVSWERSLCVCVCVYVVYVGVGVCVCVWEFLELPCIKYRESPILHASCQVISIRRVGQRADWVGGVALGQEGVVRHSPYSIRRQ